MLNAFGKPLRRRMNDNEPQARPRDEFDWKGYDWCGCVGEGWKELVDAAQILCKKEDVCILQVKEKFGTLRFYVGSAPKWVHTLIWGVEARSAWTCEWCGKWGRVRRYAWVLTLCEECAQAHEKESGMVERT
jgi:hypothetical protein